MSVEAAALADLLARVRRIEDVQAIHALKVRYCDAMDGGWDRPAHDAEAAAALFVDDATWSGGATGTATGRADILALFRTFTRFRFGFHRITNEVIDVDGDSANARWHALVPFALADGTSTFVGLIYHDRLVRKTEGWRFTSVMLQQCFTSGQDLDWRIGSADRLTAQH